MDEAPVEELVEALPGGRRVTHSAYYECREAAHWLGIPWPAWEALTGPERALHVAHYRVHHELQAVLSHRAQQPKGGSG